MRDRRSFTIEGTVCSTPLEDSSDGCHSSIFLVTPAGQRYLVEPSFVGRYLARFDGAHVIAEARLLSGGGHGGLVRIDGLTVMKRARISTPNESPTEQPPVDSGRPPDSSQDRQFEGSTT